MRLPEFPLATPWHDGTIPVAAPRGERPIDPAAYRQARTAAMKLFAEEKAGAVLIASEKQYGLLNMSTFSREYQQAPLPVAYTTREDYEQLWRLPAVGGGAEAEGENNGAFSGKAVPVENTNAGSRGTEKPGGGRSIGGPLHSMGVG